jgi:hypothetical protein
LNDILSPIKITSLATDVVTSIAGESEERQEKRMLLTNQLDVLVQGSEICERFVVRTLESTPASSSTSASSDISWDIGPSKKSGKMKKRKGKRDILPSHPPSSPLKDELDTFEQ